MESAVNESTASPAIAIPRGGVLVVDENLVVIAADDAVLAVVGMSRETVVGRPIGDAFGGSEYLRVELLAALLFDSRISDRAVEWRDPSGSFRIARISATPIRLAHQESDGLFVGVEDGDESVVPLETAVASARSRS